MADHDMPAPDAQDRAEQVDDEAIRLDPHGVDPDGLPGVNTYSDRGPMQSEDPNLLLGGSETRDEIHTREWRERDELLPEDVAQGEAPRTDASDAIGGLDLVDPADSVDAGRDVEKTLIAETSPRDHDTTEQPAEVDAINLTDPPD